MGRFYFLVSLLKFCFQSMHLINLSVLHLTNRDLVISYIKLSNSVSKLDILPQVCFGKCFRKFCCSRYSSLPSSFLPFLSFFFRQYFHDKCFSTNYCLHALWSAAAGLTYRPFLSALEQTEAFSEDTLSSSSRYGMYTF